MTARSGGSPRPSCYPTAPITSGAHVTMAVDRSFEKRLASLVNGRTAGALRGGLKGVEKESLRVTPEGRVSTTPP